MKILSGAVESAQPERTLTFGYLTYIVFGVLLLSIPLFRKTDVPLLDNLFIVVSAISTTGLTTVAVSDSYTFWGQVVVIVLIQLGGIGYMTFGSFIVLSSKHPLSKSREKIHKAAFSLPAEFRIPKFIRSVVTYTAAVETIGALLIYLIIRNDPRANPVWSAVFHSISSFCTAGFSLYTDSFESYANNAPLNIVVSILSVLGAIGYIVMVDVWLLLRRKKREVTFTSRIILLTTAVLWAAGTILLSLDGFTFEKRGGASILHYVFQSMTALTTVGFNTIPISQLRSFSLFALLILMIVGASPSGTGGGIKSTTISCLAGVVKSVLSRDKEYIASDMGIGGARREKGRSRAVKTGNEARLLLADVFKIKIMKQAIPFDRILHAVATFTFYFAILFLGVLLLLLREPFPFESVLFEAASALGTVGLSAGITSGLSAYGKTIVILLMFIGRLGPITFGVFLFSRSSSEAKQGNADIVV